jgi:hypothetical protein
MPRRRRAVDVPRSRPLLRLDETGSPRPGASGCRAKARGVVAWRRIRRRKPNPERHKVTKCVSGSFRAGWLRA